MSALGDFLSSLASDPERHQRWLADNTKEMAEAGLSPEDIEAVESGRVGEILARLDSGEGIARDVYCLFAES